MTMLALTAASLCVLGRVGGGRGTIRSWEVIRRVDRWGQPYGCFGGRQAKTGKLKKQGRRRRGGHASERAASNSVSNGNIVIWPQDKDKTETQTQSPYLTLGSLHYLYIYTGSSVFAQVPRLPFFPKRHLDTHTHTHNPRPISFLLQTNMPPHPSPSDHLHYLYLYTQAHPS
jgi:hypothetical protein